MDYIDDINTLEIPPSLTPEQADEFCIQKMIRDYIEYPYTIKDRFKQLSQISPEALSDLYKGFVIRDMQYEMELSYLDGKLATLTPEKLAQINITQVTNISEYEKEKSRNDILIKQQALREMKLYITDISDRNKCNKNKEVANTERKANSDPPEWILQALTFISFLLCFFASIITASKMPLIIPADEEMDQCLKIIGVLVVIFWFIGIKKVFDTASEKENSLMPEIIMLLPSLAFFIFATKTFY